MWLFSMLLQAAPAVGTDPVAAHGESYFSLMAKGGVILIPIFLLAGLAIFRQVAFSPETGQER